MRKMMQRSLSCLLTLAMVVTMLMTSTLAAEKSVKITLEYPKDVPANDVVVTMFKGIPHGIRNVKQKPSKVLSRPSPSLIAKTIPS